MKCFSRLGHLFNPLFCCAQGMEPDEIARRILVAVATEAEEVIAADFKTKAAVIARALCPGLLSSYMKSRAAKGWKELKKE